MKVESRPHAARAFDEARRSFKDLPVVHVGSVLTDGTPHVVPLWFVWLEEGLVVSSREGSQVWTNLRRNPSVVLQFDRGRAWLEYSGVLLRGRAAPVAPDGTLGKRALSAWFDKYRHELSGGGFASYAETVRRPTLFEVRPERMAGWRHTFPP